MAKSIYLLSNKESAGLSIVALGLMEQLMGLGMKLGVFLPIYSQQPFTHPLVNLLLQRYQLDFRNDEVGGCAEQQAIKWLSDGQSKRLIKHILERYKKLESQCDCVLIIGPQFSDEHYAFSADINIDIANNLGAWIISIINAKQQKETEILDAISMHRELIHQHSGDLLAMVVNRVEANIMELLSLSLKKYQQTPPVFVIANDVNLSMPSLGEVADTLDCEWLHGGKSERQRMISGYKIAAMEMPHFLEHIEEGDLVITPGDRADIILASLLAHKSQYYPHLAGLILTGGLNPADSISQLISGLRNTKFPILSVASDTYETTMQVVSSKAKLSADNSKKIAMTIGLIEAVIDRTWLKSVLVSEKNRQMTPSVFEYELISRAKGKRCHILLPEAKDDRVLRAAEIIVLRDVCDISFLGDEQRIKAKISQLGLKLENIPIIDPHTSELKEKFSKEYYQLRQHKGISFQMAEDRMLDVNYFGTMMVYCGLVDGMVSGAIHTTQQTVRPSFEIIKTQENREIISSVFLMCLADRVLVYGDCAVNPNPNAEQLADIAIASAETATQFGIEPRVAMLSYSTGDSGTGDDVEIVRQATLQVRQQYPHLMIDGPIQYDAAVDKHVALSKMPDSKLAGNASVFVFPDLNTGNNTYKAVQRSTGAVAIGPVLQGLRKPVNDLSRGCSVTDIVNTIAITAIQSQSQRA